MGFGSYDESERENQRIDAEDFEDDEHWSTAPHDGEVSFVYEDASTEDLLDAYAEIRDQ